MQGINLNHVYSHYPHLISFPGTINIHLSVQIFQACKPVWYLNMILLLTLNPTVRFLDVAKFTTVKSNVTQRKGA
jgi:hypothetical protein